MISNLDKKIISLVSKDIPLVKEPFKELADILGIEEQVLLARIKLYKKNGFMRKFAASLNHKKVGFRHNAMVVWNMPIKSIEKAGEYMVSFPQASHCYQRKTAPDWDYNLYSMIHGKTRKECLDVVKKIAKETACSEYRILFSCREYKKTAAVL